MDTTLAVNPGSSSKKYALYNGDTELLQVRVEKEGGSYRLNAQKGGMVVRDEEITEEAYADSLTLCLETCVREGVINHHEDIRVIGVRVVAPHPFFCTHRIIDDVYVATLTETARSAMLHIPSTLKEIESVQRAIPNVAVIGVSDSAYHASVPELSSWYSIPRVDREAFHARRYGYHGLSVQSVMRALEKIHGSLPERVIVAHVGSGASVTAVLNGKSIETTMGFAPASGLIMNSRGGDIDASALLHLMREKNMSVDTAEEYLNTQTGLFGLTGESDLRVILARAEKRDRDALTALDMYVHRLTMAFGASRSVLGGMDAIVLTATVVERNAVMRARIIAGFSNEGVRIDPHVNECLFERAGRISDRESTVPIYMIPTHEMREVARVAESFVS